MRITCFQCRQQLEVPEDSAGRRVHCPHCDYVVVVPAPAATNGESGEAATALPSLELDAGADRPMETKVAPMPLPPITPAPEEQSRSKPASLDDLPPLPPIDRGKRRRVSMSPLAKPGLPWVKIIVIGGVVVLVAIGVIIGVVSSQANRRQRQFQVVVNQPKPHFHFPVEKKPDLDKAPPWQPAPFPKQNLFLPPVNPLPWRDYQNEAHRFRVQFPGAPIQLIHHINGAPMTMFEVKHFAWEFTVGHRVLTGKGLPNFQHVGLFINTEIHLRNLHGGFRTRDIPIQLKGGHPGQEWDFALQNNARLFAQTFLVRDGDVQHHFVLTVRTPNNFQRFHQDVVRFFNSFQPLEQSKGTPFHEELDDIVAGARRDNEITTFAAHPKKPVVALGNRDGQVAVVRPNQQILFTPEVGKPIDQVGVSTDGRWLGIAVGGNLHFRKDWENGGNFADNFVMPGLRFVFAKKEQHLFLATRDEVSEVKLGEEAPIATMPIADLNIEGLAVSPDQRIVAVFGGKAIAILDWTAKKLLGRFDAHAEAITTLVFSPDGATLASASVDRTIKLWDVAKRAERATLKHHAWTVAALAFTPDGKQLASGGLDGMFLLWDLQQKPPRPAWAQAHQFPVRAVAFDSTGKHGYLTVKHPVGVGAQGGRRYARRLLKFTLADIKPNIPAAERLIAQQAGLHLPVTSTMSFLSPDARAFVSTTDGIDNFATSNSLRIWDLPTGTLREARSMKFFGVMSPDGQWVVFAKPGPINQMQILDMKTRRVIDHGFTWQGNVFPLVLFAPDSNTFWVQRHHEFIRCEIRTPADGMPSVVQHPPLLLRKPNEFAVLQIHPAADHRTFLVERRVDGVVRSRTLYSSLDGKEIPTPAPKPNQASPFVRLEQTGNQIDLRDILHGSSLTIGQQRHRMNQHAIAPNGKLAASVCSGNDPSSRIYFWSLQERRPLLTLSDSRTRAVTALRFSPDGSLLALVTGDSWTRIVPVDWLLERQQLLPCNPAEVAGR